MTDRKTSQVWILNLSLFTIFQNIKSQRSTNPLIFGSSTFLRSLHFWAHFQVIIVKLQGLGLRLGVDFTFTLDNNHNNDNNDNHNNNDNNDNDNNNPHLDFFKGTVLGAKEQGLGIRDKG